MSVLLYGCESWTLYHRHVKLLDQFHQRCLRRILNVKRYNGVSNARVLLEAQMPNIYARLIQSQLRWSVHLVRMQDNRLSKKIFYGELTVGHRSRGRPKLRYKDTMNPSRNVTLMKKKTKKKPGKSWPQGWSHAIRKGTEAYESDRQSSQQVKPCSNEGQNHHRRAFH